MLFWLGTILFGAVASIFAAEESHKERGTYNFMKPW